MANTNSNAVEIATTAFNQAFAQWEAARAKLATAKQEFVAIGMSKAEAAERAEDMFGAEVETTQRTAAQLCDVMRAIEADERESVN